MMRRIQIGLLSGVIVCLVGAVLLTPTPATAAVAAPPSSRTAPPVGTGWSWGVPRASLPTDCDEHVDAGGWDVRRIVSTGNPIVVSYRPLPSMWVAAEPCYVAANNNGQRFTLAALYFSMAASGNASNSNSYGGTDHAAWTLVCAATEWSQTQTTYTRGPGGSWGGSGPSVVESGGWDTRSATGTPAWTNGGTAPTDANCPFIVRATASLCGYVSDGAAPWGGDPLSCTSASWTAERWFRNTPYVDAVFDDPEVALCEVYADASNDCVYVNDPTGVDGTDFGLVCSNGPIFYPPGWADFDDWVPDLVEWWTLAIGHFARCLFVPVNGWDQGGLISNAWETSAFVEATNLVEDTTTAFTFTEGCGVILNFGAVGSFSPGEGGVDTCEWATWSEPVRTGISIIVTLGFGWWALQFVITTFLGLIRAVPMWDPLTMAMVIHHHVPGS